MSASHDSAVVFRGVGKRFDEALVLLFKLDAPPADAVEQGPEGGRETV